MKLSLILFFDIIKIFIKLLWNPKEKLFPTNVEGDKS